MTDPKELLRQTKALIRDAELYSASNKPLPILPKDIELLRAITNLIDKKITT